MRKTASVQAKAVTGLFGLSWLAFPIGPDSTDVPALEGIQFVPVFAIVASHKVSESEQLRLLEDLGLHRDLQQRDYEHDQSNELLHERWFINRTRCRTCCNLRRVRSIRIVKDGRGYLGSVNHMVS